VRLDNWPAEDMGSSWHSVRCARSRIRHLMRSTLKALAVLTLLTLGVCAYAQSPGVTVAATLIDGQGNIQKTGYLHFELWNCGNNVPQIPGNALAIVAQQFDMRPNPGTGLITGAIYGQDQILCGNTNSTQWVVTQYKASNQPGGQPQYYCLVSGQTFNPALTQPAQQPNPLRKRPEQRGGAAPPGGEHSSPMARRSRGRMACIPFCVPRRARIQVRACHHAFGAKRKPADLAGFSGC